MSKKSNPICGTIPDKKETQTFGAISSADFKEKNRLPEPSPHLNMIEQAYNPFGAGSIAETPGDVNWNDGAKFDEIIEIMCASSVTVHSFEIDHGLSFNPRKTVEHFNRTSVEVASKLLPYVPYPIRGLIPITALEVDSREDRVVFTGTADFGIWNRIVKHWFKEFVPNRRTYTIPGYRGPIGPRQFTTSTTVDVDVTLLNKIMKGIFTTSLESGAALLGFSPAAVVVKVRIDNESYAVGLCLKLVGIELPLYVVTEWKQNEDNSKQQRSFKVFYDNKMMTQEEFHALLESVAKYQKDAVTPRVAFAEYGGHDSAAILAHHPEGHFDDNAPIAGKTQTILDSEFS